MTQGKKGFLLRDEFKQANFDTGGRPERLDGRPGRDRRDREMRPRGAATGASRRSGPSFSGDHQLESYRIEVGHAHQVKPGNIVGAIANEAGIDSAFIGRIEIFERYSTVDLPKGMPADMLRSLGQAKIAGRAMRISSLASTSPRRADRPARSTKGDRS